MKKFLKIPRETFLLVVLFSLFLNGSAFGFYPSKKDTSSTKTDTIAYYDKFSVAFGGFFAGFHNTINLASDDLGVGIAVDLEKALNLNVTSWAFRAKANYRFGNTNRHRIAFSYINITRNSNKTLENELPFGDTILPVGLSIHTKFQYSIIRFKYDYAFYQDDRISLGASFGLFILPMKLDISVDGEGVTGASYIAPLPALGLRLDFLISPRLYFRQSLEVLYLSYDGFTGSLTDIDLSLEYEPVNYFGFGIGFNKHVLDLKARADAYPTLDFTGTITSDFSGLYLFAKFSL